MEQHQKETELIRELEKYPSSAIAICMQKGNDYQRRAQLFDSRKDKWYTDATIKCQFPEFGPRAGYAVTMRVGLPVEGYVPPTRAELLKLIDASPKPVVLVMQVDEPEEMRLSDSNFGGQFGYLCKQLGMESLISDGAIRDVAELRDFGIQLMIPGSIAATAPSVIYELNGTVTVGGMEVSAGDIVHMDYDGAVKMPREEAEKVLACAKVLEEEEKLSFERMKKAQTLDDYLKIFYDMGYGLNKKDKNKE
ncbi:MAG: hypothetical protein IJL47_09485 [Lachnospiraceae bacterium]|nr:hypothetical protein [Lachnospiraceae bacterium]